MPSLSASIFGFATDIAIADNWNIFDGLNDGLNAAEVNCA
jgi:hypothetical protein